MEPHRRRSTRCSPKCARASRKPTSRCRRRTATGSTGSSSRKAPNTRSGGASRLRRRGADELILDEVALAEGKEYFRLGAHLGQQGRAAARLFGRRQRLGTLHRADQGPRHRRAAARRNSRHAVLAGVGRGRHRRWSTRSPTRTGAPTTPGCTGWASRFPSDVELYPRGRRGLPRRRRRCRPTRTGSIIAHRRPRDQRSAAGPGRRSARPSRSWCKPRQKGVEYDVDVRDGTVCGPHQRHAREFPPRHRAARQSRASGPR